MTALLISLGALVLLGIDLWWEKCKKDCERDGVINLKGQE